MKPPVFAGSTDTGLQRPQNEDAFGMAPEHGIAVLADGMGAHNAGEVASQMAVSTVLAILGQTTGIGAHDRLETAIQAAHAGILEKATSATRYQGMGTTIVAVILEKLKLHVAHVGDSRLYQLRKGALTTLTRDHSLLQEFIDKGLYSPEEAREKVARNILTHALGLESDLRIDITEVFIQGGDRYLLCSDGLYEMVNDTELAALLNRRLPAAETCSVLIELANAKGGKDNITVIVIDVP